ncbi:MAG: zinc ribbon domain-containing protein [Elusimicrobia bacterium]|nr:zinc ribbon domain-containing protein [Elusimicrobiota bacterium]
MKCLNCGQENKDSAKVCKKCNRGLSAAPAWFPDFRWHLKTLGFIYLGVVAFYFITTFALRQLPKPYHLREIPPEMTPWLRKGPKFLPEDQLKAPADAPAPAPAAP